MALRSRAVLLRRARDMKRGKREVATMAVLATGGGYRVAAMAGSGWLQGSGYWEVVTGK